MSPNIRTLYLFWTLLSILSYCIADEVQESETNSETETSEIQIPSEPQKDNHGIWILNDNQFDPFIDTHEDVAVLFTQPDDLYSYAGKYHFDRAAHILRNLRNSTTEFAVSIADPESTKIHDEFGIDEYPSMKYCHHDRLGIALKKANNQQDENENDNDNENDSDDDQQELQDQQEWETRCLDYNHHVVELQVVKWVEGLKNSCSFIIDNVDQFETAKSEHDVLLIGFFKSTDDLEYKLFEDLCKQYKYERDIWAYAPSFAVVFNEEFALTLSESIPGIIIYCEFKEHAWIFNGPMTDRNAIKSFIDTERYPFFTQITAFNYKQYTQELGLPLVWVAIDDQYQSYVKKVGRFYEQMGVKYKGYFAIIWISSRSFMGHIRKLGLPFVPGVLYYDEENNYKQLYDPQASIFDNEGITRFFDSCLDGTGEIFIKSQTDEEIQGAIEKDLQHLRTENILIKHINGNELYQILDVNEELYGNYNVVVFYYAPYDERSKSFHSVFEHIAELLLNHDGTPMFDNLLLLKMDATKNDTPNRISAYPKIELYKNNVWPKTASNDNYLVYRGGRNENTMIKWIVKQCEYELPKQQMQSISIGADGEQQKEPENEPFEYY